MNSDSPGGPPHVPSPAPFLPLSVTAGLAVLLCDADGNLFPSEEPAFAASAGVTNRFLADLGVPARYTPAELLAATTGKNFRTTAVDLAVAHGVPVDPAVRPGHPGRGGPVLTPGLLERWVAEEKAVVTAHLGEVLRPDPGVLAPLQRLAGRHALAVVSSSALSRLDVCFRATGLADLLPAGRRFSAEDSLPRPTSKPDPAVYAHALRELGLTARQALAVEDAVPGVQSAVAAGIGTVGNVMFVPAAERAAREAALREAGAAHVAGSWEQIAAAAELPGFPGAGVGSRRRAADHSRH